MKLTALNWKKKYKVSTFKKTPSFFLFAICIMLFGFSTYGQRVIHESELHNNTSLLSNDIDTEKISSLLYDHNAAAYFQNGQVNYYGDQPLVLYVDFEQLSTIPMQSENLQEVELVKIYMKTNSPQQIATQNFSGLPSLQYVFLVCDRCTASNLKNLFSTDQEMNITKNILTVFNSDEKN